MKLPRRNFLHHAAGAAALPVLSRIAQAQAYPTRPVRVIVPYAPAGPTDIVARLIAQALSQQVGKQFYVENIPGAGGNIGMARAAQATPDGYTMVVVPPNYVINPSLYDKVPYDPHNDFDPVTLAVTTTVVLTVNPSLPANTVKDLVALINTHPRKYSYGSGGPGTPGHLVGEQFRLSRGLDLVHVPFNSAGLAIGSAVAGHTSIAIAAPAPALSPVNEGKLRALAVTSKKRTRALPEVPTMSEAGYPEIEFDNWLGVLVPARTPKEIITSLNSAIAKVLTRPDMQERLAALAFEPVGSAPEEFAKRAKIDFETWGKVIRASKIKP
jgi:tripartite-type tricarboxylate transporter receptor subunit TctC